MDDLIFREQDHVYLLEGEELPCVSDLCRFLHREIYKNAPAWQMEAAAIRGTAVHAASQDLDNAGTATIEGIYAGYLLAYKRFLEEHSVSWQLTEKSFYHSQYRYAGTIDRYGTIDGCTALVDFKTTCTVYKPLFRASLNLYRMMLEDNGFAVDRLYILHLKQDGRYRLVAIKVDSELPLALITLHKALQKKRRRKNV